MLFKIQCHSDTTRLLYCERIIVSRGLSSGTRPFLKRVGALVRSPDESILLCFLPGGARRELILFPCRIREGGGRILAHQRGSVKFGVRGDWGGAVRAGVPEVEAAIPRALPR